MTDPYREIVVWQRLDEGRAVRYACFENLRTGWFAVQNAAWYYLPINQSQIEGQARERIQLFIEDDPCVRSGSHESLEEAIAAFNGNVGTSGE